MGCRTCGAHLQSCHFSAVAPSPLHKAEVPPSEGSECVPPSVLASLSLSLSLSVVWARPVLQ
eukprot:4487603-Amphidinium_carterae.1